MAYRRTRHSRIRKYTIGSVFSKNGENTETQNSLTLAEAKAPRLILHVKVNWGAICQRRRDQPKTVVI